jgi:hypothetical protein
MHQTKCAGTDDLHPNFDAHFGDHAQDVADGGIRVGAADEVGSGQGVEVGDVAVDVVRVIIHVAQLVCHRRHLVAEAAIHRLGAGHVVTGRADPANARHDPGQFLDWPAHNEALEAPQFGDLEEAVLHRADIVEEDLDLAVALKAGDGINFDGAAHRWWLLSKIEAGIPNRYAKLMKSGSRPTISSISLGSLLSMIEAKALTNFAPWSITAGAGP